jgi:hypothetical protein
LRDIDITGGRRPSTSFATSIVLPIQSIPSSSDKLTNSTALEMVWEMREYNEKFEQFQVTAASILSLSDVMKQQVEILNVVKNDIGVMVANVSSLITNLEATLKTTKGVKVIPTEPETEVREEVHDEKNKKLLMETDQIYEGHLNKYKFKGIRKKSFHTDVTQNKYSESFLQHYFQEIAMEQKELMESLASDQASDRQAPVQIDEGGTSEMSKW